MGDSRWGIGELEKSQYRGPTSSPRICYPICTLFGLLVIRSFSGIYGHSFFSFSSLFFAGERKREREEEGSFTLAAAPLQGGATLQ